MWLAALAQILNALRVQTYSSPRGLPCSGYCRSKASVLTTILIGYSLG